MACPGQCFQLLRVSSKVVQCTSTLATTSSPSSTAGVLCVMCWCRLRRVIYGGLAGSLAALVLMRE